MILPFYDDQDQERRELLCISPSQVLLARDTLQAAFLKHSPGWQKVADMDHITASSPPAGHQVPPMPTFVKAAVSKAYVFQKFSVTQVDKMPLDVDAYVDGFGTSHGKAAFEDHVSKLDDMSLKLACLRRGALLDNKELRRDFVDALWRSSLARVKELRLRRKRKYADRVEDNKLQIEMLIGGQQTTFNIVLALQQIFEERMAVDKWCYQQHFDSLESQRTHSWPNRRANWSSRISSFLRQTK